MGLYSEEGQTNGLCIIMVVTSTLTKPTEGEMRVCFGFLSMFNPAIANYKAIELRTRLVNGKMLVR